MRIQYFEDNAIETIVKANIDAFLADCRIAAGQSDLAKNVRETREAQEVDHELSAFIESLEPGPTGGRATGHTRLRSERPVDERDLGLEKSGDRRKLALRGWLASQLAIGKSASELIEHAARHDPQTANLLREIFAEMETA